MRLSSSLSSSIRFLFLMAAVAALLFTQFHSAYGGAKAWRKERMLGGRVGWSPPSPATNPVKHQIPPELPSPPERN
ncbi:unnamed protein product [Musa textilis]